MSAQKKHWEYKYPKDFKVSKDFPNDIKFTAIRKKMFKANGNGWWAKNRVETVNIPDYWVVSKRFKLNGIWQTDEIGD